MALRLHSKTCGCGAHRLAVSEKVQWHGKGDIRCEEVPDPQIEHPRDAIIKITACAICGSDLHIYGGIIPAMKKGDVLGHENMGEVVEVGPENKALKVGDRVVHHRSPAVGHTPAEQIPRGPIALSVTNTDALFEVKSQSFLHGLAAIFEALWPRSPVA
jgi:hypothetical protein